MPIYHHQPRNHIPDTSKPATPLRALAHALGKTPAQASDLKRRAEWERNGWPIPDTSRQGR